MARTKSTLTGPSKALWPGMCHLFGGLARLGSTGSFQRSPEPQLLLWPKAASAAVNALRRNRTSGTPKGVPTMWATRGVRESPAHRQSAFLLLEVLRPGQNHRALNSLQCPDDGNARRQKIWTNSTQSRSSSCGRYIQPKQPKSSIWVVHAPWPPQIAIKVMGSPPPPT